MFSEVTKTPYFILLLFADFQMEILWTREEHKSTFFNNVFLFIARKGREVGMTSLTLSSSCSPLSLPLSSPSSLLSMSSNRQEKRQDIKRPRESFLFQCLILYCLITHNGHLVVGDTHLSVSNLLLFFLLFLSCWHKHIQHTWTLRRRVKRWMTQG